VLHTFVRTVGIYPVGAIVRLESQRIAIVHEQNVNAYLKPVVQAFYSLKTRLPTALQRVDLAAPGATTASSRARRARLELAELRRAVEVPLRAGVGARRPGPAPGLLAAVGSSDARGRQRRSSSALRDHADAGQRHRRAGHHRAEAAQGGQRDAHDVVGEGPEEVLPHLAVRGAGKLHRFGHQRAGRRAGASSPAVCMATSVPPATCAMAMPTSAAASAGASLMPSPTIADAPRRPAARP
jgi:hypothetical protein